MVKSIIWQFSTFPIMRDLWLFNRISIGNHFPTCKTFCIEFLYEHSMVGYSGFYKRWELANDLTETKVAQKGKLQKITIRLGQPIIGIFFSKAFRKKAIEATNRYQITY